MLYLNQWWSIVGRTLSNNKIIILVQFRYFLFQENGFEVILYATTLSGNIPKWYLSTYMCHQTQKSTLDAWISAYSVLTSKLDMFNFTDLEIWSAFLMTIQSTSKCLTEFCEILVHIECQDKYGSWGPTDHFRSWFYFYSRGMFPQGVCHLSLLSQGRVW